jgi:[ribosomal protein S5]-alanine N-acetyltransferase
MNAFNFFPFQTLTSKRLFLRQITDADIEEVFALRSNPELMLYIPRPVAKNKQDALDHIKMIQNMVDKSEGINWAITLKDSPKMIGIIGHYRIKWEHFRSEIGYMILPEYQGKGLVTEAVGLMIDYGFQQMKMHSLEAIIDPDNLASAKVLEKNKFVKEGHFKENTFFEGKYYDSAVYSLLNKSTNQ